MYTRYFSLILSSSLWFCPLNKHFAEAIQEVQWNQTFSCLSTSCKNNEGWLQFFNMFPSTVVSQQFFFKYLPVFQLIALILEVSSRSVGTGVALLFFYSSKSQLMLKLHFLLKKPPTSVDIQVVKNVILTGQALFEWFFSSIKRLIISWDHIWPQCFFIPSQKEKNTIIVLQTR